MTRDRELPPIPKPPTQDDLLDVFSRVVPAEYYEGITGHPSFALYRGVAAMWAVLARKLSRGIQARYYLPHALQQDPPASEARRAVGDVTLRRTHSLQHPLVVLPGELVVEAVGRVYRNADTVTWYPGDAAHRRVRFAAEVPGFASNVDVVDLDQVAIADQSRSRTGVGGSAVPTQVVRDSGRDDLFAPDDVGLYLRVNGSADPDNVGRVLKVVGHAWPEQEIPPGTGLFPRQVTLDTAPPANASEVLLEEPGPTFAEYTAASRLETEDDVPLLPQAPAVDDTWYVGFVRPFGAMAVGVTTPGEGDWDVVWEYWDGAAWSALSLKNEQTQEWLVTHPGTYRVEWDVPPDWAATTSPGGSGLSLYYVRARLVSVTTVDAVPLAGRVAVFSDVPLAADSGSLGWSLLDFRDLGLEIVDCTAFEGGRDDDLYILGDERGVYRQPGEDPDAFRRHAAKMLDVVSPAAIRRTVNRALAPLGFVGDAIDAGNGLTGFFWDVDAFEYYEPGDAYPEDPWKLLLSYEEAHGHFLVLVPWLHQGEFGMFYDEGHHFQDGATGDWYGPAYSGWYDGYPHDAYGAYGAVYAGVQRAKLFGVSFDLVRDLDQNAAGC